MALICLFILAVAGVASAIFYQRKSEYLQSMVADLQDELEVAAMFVASSKEEAELLLQDIDELNAELHRLHRQ